MPASGALRYLALRKRKSALSSKEKKQVSSIAKRVINKTIEKKWYLSNYAARS